MARFISFTCEYCQQPASQPAGAVNRARRRGVRLYCDRECAGLDRRKHKTVAEKKAEKAAYDAQYRIDFADRLKAEKAARHKRTYDPVKAAAKRKQRMPRHVEYCRQPAYRAWKKDYDRQFRAAKEYGEFADCFLLVQDIRAECLSQMSDYEIRYAKGSFGKSQQRRRAYERLVSDQSEVGALGDLERGKGWQDGGHASGLRRLSGAGNPAHDQHAASRGAAGQAARLDGRDHLRGKLTADDGDGRRV